MTCVQILAPVRVLEKLMIIITLIDDPQELPTMRVTASEEDMVKFKPDDASLTEANMRAVLKQFKV